MRPEFEIVERLGLEMQSGWSYFLHRGCVFRCWTKSTFPPGARGVLLPFVRGRSRLGGLYTLDVGTVAELVTYCTFAREPGFYYCLTEDGDVARLRATTGFSIVDGGELEA